ncbi:MAG: ankyrin repeat domain-containing protein, partial [Burkholderiales bacterium]
MLAAYNGHEHMVDALLKNNAKPNQPGWNALIYAAAKGETQIVRRLLEAGAKVNAVSPNGTSALMMAARGGHMETVLMLLGNDADIRLKNQAGGTALGWAMDSGNTDIAELLIKAGAEE